MLEELTIRDFAIIDNLTVRFGAGFNVLTGETGAGKSIIIDAVGALLGSRITSEVIRSGAPSARIEGVFSWDPRSGDVDSMVRALLDDYGLRDNGDDLTSDPLILARDMTATGRSTARINGRAVPVSVLAQIGGALVDIHGQSEHLSLLRVARHCDMVDRFAGVLGQRAEVATLVRSLRALLEERAALHTTQRDAARQMDVLRFQIAEITSAALADGEEEALSAERQVLSNAERLADVAHAASAGLSGGDVEAPGVLALLAVVSKAVAELVRLDPSREQLSTTLQEAMYVIEDAAQELRRYGETVEFNPQRLAEIEDRLALIGQLKRKYGPTVADIVRFGEQIARDQASLEHSDERLQTIDGEIAHLSRNVGALAAQLSTLRQAAARDMARQVMDQLADLNLARARFSVDVRQTPDATGLPVDDSFPNLTAGVYAFDERGIDRIEFLFSANPGEDLRPLSRVASGGEMARLMLALKTILSGVDDTGTLIFDEVDTGVGGRSGAMVGAKLRYLSQQHQVLCITHLPQVAALGDEHFRIVKQIVGDRTRTDVQSLSHDERIDELAQMLAGAQAGSAARQTARDLLAQSAV